MKLPEIFKRKKKQHAYLVSWVTFHSSKPDVPVYGQSEILVDKEWGYGDTAGVCKYITEAIGGEEFQPITISGVFYLGIHEGE